MQRSYGTMPDMDTPNGAERQIWPPSMTRSRSQLLGAYAPEAYFNFEGGTGACRVVACATDAANLKRHTKRLILDRIEEMASSWLIIGRNARGQNSPRPILPEQCVDNALLDITTNEIRNLGNVFVFVLPNSVQYIPAPFTMYNANSRCGLVRPYETLKDLSRELDLLQGARCVHPKGPTTCNHSGGAPYPCRWQQLDVIFVHWSGGVQGAHPQRYEWSDVSRTVYRGHGECRNCGCEDVKLVKPGSRVGRWCFACASCGQLQPTSWSQNDKSTLEILQNRLRDENRWQDAYMMATSFRASVVHYPQGDRIINFEEGDLFECLKPDPESTRRLMAFLAIRIGIQSATPSDEEIIREVSTHPEEMGAVDQFKQLATTLGMMEELEKSGMIKEENLASIRQQLLNIKTQWTKKWNLASGGRLPAGIASRVQARRDDFGSRFDPFRLTVEHEALKREALDAGYDESGRRPYVPFVDEDEDVRHPEFDRPGVPSANEHFHRLGVETMGLLRKFRLCYFTFGYSRVSFRPVTSINRTPMPVRLNLFRQVRLRDGSCGRPVYALQQANEAIYVRLREDVVRRWLIESQCLEAGVLATDTPVARILLENAHPMDTYLDRLPVHRTQPPSAYLETFTLLHSFAHHVIKGIADLSGLDLGSLGEYIFPADLGFVVYRHGMTSDLGNLSAMWRNNGLAFLRYLLTSRSLSCGLGALCVERGGACPDCLMIPEVTCLTGNKLLSRSVLIGSGRPKEDGRAGALTGFLNIANTFGGIA